MSRSASDWKRQPTNRLDWLLFAIVCCLVGLYAYVGWDLDSRAYLTVAAGLAIVAAVYLTRYWDPSLYLLVAIALTVETVRTILAGTWQHGVLALAILLDVVYVVLAVYLFLLEEWLGERSAGA